MPSLRQKVTTYFRQLSFIADSPRSSRKAEEDGNFITKYLEGRMDRIFVPGPEIFNGTNPTDLPDLKLRAYPIGPTTITAACTGPDEGLTGIKRSKLHLSASYADDIDFIDTIQESDCYEIRKSIVSNHANSRGHGKFGRYGAGRRPSGGGSGGIGGASNSSTNNNNNIASHQPASDQNANKVSAGMRSRKNSKTSISNLSQTSGAGTGNAASSGTGTSGMGKESSKAAKASGQDNKSTTIVVSMVSSKNVTAIEGLNAKSKHQSNSTSSTTDSSNELNAQTVSVNGTSTLNPPSKLLPDTTERILREAVSNQAATLNSDAIAGVSDWKMETDYAYGISVSLYENNMLTKEPIGSPIADCFGMVVRDDAAVMALADGVNWGDGARLAARSAVQGCLDYLDRAVFGLAQECMATSTQEVFVSLLRSLWEGHGCILEVGGSLSTLTIAVVLPLAKFAVESGSEYDNGDNTRDTASSKYVVCACNVGDSLGYVYSKKHGVREFTMASHDITNMRDMRDALGALGPADGNKPELSNLTLSMTIIERGDIVFLTSDGISDNFDPVVGKFAEAWTPDVKLMPSSHGSRGHGSVLAPKRQNKSASALYSKLHHTDSAASSTPVRPPRHKKASPPSEETQAVSRPKYMRSQTVIEPRRLSTTGLSAVRVRAMSPMPSPKIPKSIAGLPLVTGPQRHALTLYRLEDLLSYGINGTFSPCSSARRLCHLLIDFVRMITAARRNTLEQRELFYKLSTGADGIKREVELNRMQHRAARRRIMDSNAFIALPGKLDHATVVAYTVGGSRGTPTDNDSPDHPQHPTVAPLQSKEFQETNF